MKLCPILAIFFEQMQLFIFLLVYPLIWFLSILPLRVLYILSDIIYVPLYYVFGYRKKVVRHNLKLAFPEKKQQELLKIEKKSIRHFIDTFMEMIKTFDISEREILNRITIENPKEIERLIKNNKSVIIISSHYANWEWAVHLMVKLVDCDGFGSYTKIGNKYFEEKIKKSRSKFGANLVLSSRFIRQMQKNYDEKIQAIYGFLSDQSPLLKKAYYWNNFMGIRVPIIIGHELMAKRFDYPVIYLQTDRIKRGYYTSKITILTENPRELPDYQITDKFIKILEGQIRKNPEFYFWTHNRFKHVGKEKGNLKTTAKNG